MTGWLLDTYILSAFAGRDRSPRWLVSSRLNPLSSFYVSTVTFAEIRYGIECVDDPRRRADDDWITHKLRPMFERREPPIDEDVIFKWRLLVEEGRKTGHTFSQPDLFIGATALHHGLTVVTRDADDYARAKVPVFNPWSDPGPSASS